MKRWRRKDVFFKIAWLIGLVVLAFLLYQIQFNVEQHVKSTFNPLPLYWTKLCITILAGCYIAIILIDSWKFSVNFSLLFLVSVPCIIISSLFPILIVLSNAHLVFENLFLYNISIQLSKLYSMNIFGFVAGLTLIISLFSNKKYESTV